jgi:hypothetical protein
MSALLIAIMVPPPVSDVLAVSPVAPGPDVVAADATMSVNPAAVDVACAIWPAAVMAVASESAVPCVAPEPPFADATTLAVPFTPALVALPIAVAMAPPPAPGVAPFRLAPPVADAVEFTIVKPVRLIEATATPPAPSEAPLPMPPAPPLA